MSENKNKKDLNEIWKSLNDSTPLIINKVPNGRYSVQLDKLKLDEQAKVIHWEFTILDGPYDGSSLKREDDLSDDSQIAHTQHDLYKCKIWFENIHDINDEYFHDEEVNMVILKVEVRDDEVKICERIQYSFS